MKFFMDFATSSLNKYGEELCGDKVEFLSTKDGFIAVLSDGLGSGVKANILATLTAKIAITMLRDGLPIEEVVDTIIHTLPVCSVRKLAYSTFTIIKVDKSGKAYIVEFDNPSIFFIRDDKIQELDKVTTMINDRLIHETIIQLKETDTLVFVSDGVIHAGAGMVLNLGWSWPEVAHYLENMSVTHLSAKMVTTLLLGVCEDLYIERPGDDTTVATIKVTRPKCATLFSGPPRNKEKDQEVVKELMGTNGKKIVCGGTAANLVARELQTTVTTSFDIIDPSIPPIGHIRGVDLVTEGVLTLQAAVERLERIPYSKDINFLYQQDGASRLACMLYEECTQINFMIGQAINPAHQNPDFPEALSIKRNILNRLQETLTKLGKIVTVTYY